MKGCHQLTIQMCAAAAAVLAVFAADTASAARRTLSISTAGVRPVGGATVGLNLQLDETGISAFSFSFVLPRDFRPGSRAKLVVPLHGLDAPCSVQMQPFDMARARVGEAVDRSGTGISVVDGLIDLDDPEIVGKAEFLLSPGTGFPGQRPGDAVSLSIARLANSVADTCGTVFVHGIELVYRSR